jgi:hypothetical protein
VLAVVKRSGVALALLLAGTWFAAAGPASAQVARQSVLQDGVDAASTTQTPPALHPALTPKAKDPKAKSPGKELAAKESAPKSPLKDIVAKDGGAKDIVVFGGFPTEEEVLELRNPDGTTPLPLNIGLSADMKLERGMAAVGYAFARLDPEQAAAVYRLRLLGQEPQVDSKVIWSGDGKSAMRATLFIVDSATLVRASGEEPTSNPSFMDLSVEARKFLSDRIRVDAGVTKPLLRDNELGEFNGFTSKVGQGMTLQAGLGYIPLNNITLGLESIVQGQKPQGGRDPDRMFNLSGKWAANDDLLIGAAFVFYEQGSGDSSTDPLAVSAPGRSIEINAYFDINESKNLVLGISAKQQTAGSPAGYGSLPGGINEPSKTPLFEISLKSDF